MKIRTAVQKDAKALAELMEHADESGFMLFNPGERKVRPEMLEERFLRAGNEGVTNIFIAEGNNGELIGYLMLLGNRNERARHKAYIVIGVAEQARGKGAGTRLFAECEEHARRLNLHRLELTVITHNEAAIALYKKMGFEIEGTKRDSLYFGGKFADEFCMSKLLG
ncbi:N-acetyltransferase family protein [Peribacillus sp. B-H-3]|uniref:GNAT family N-acetyltransferase n=1 Tax=Peribacillus sp. B-H-3 TaxID=3400420 RepID=UPI003B01D814